MSIYNLYYEIPARKYRVSVSADNLADAQKQGEEKIIWRVGTLLHFVKCERRPDDVVDQLKNLFGMFDGVKK